MQNTKNASQIIDRGGKILKGNWGRAIVIMLLISVLSSILSSLLNWLFVTEDPMAMMSYMDLYGDLPPSFFIGNFLSSFLIVIVATGFQLGERGAYLDMADTGNLEIEKVFEPFTQKFGRTILYSLIYNILIFLWSLLLIIPGIVKMFAYAMAPYIMKEDKEIGAYDAIQKSNEMMKGHKGRLFSIYFRLMILPILIVMALMILGMVLFARGFAIDNTSLYVIAGILLIALFIGTIILVFYLDIRYKAAETVFYQDLTDITIVEDNDLKEINHN